MKVKNIIIKYLKDNGYDGLCNPREGCGCLIKDLFFCIYDSCMECQPGYKCTIKKDCEEGGECVFVKKDNHKCMQESD